MNDGREENREEGVASREWENKEKSEILPPRVASSFRLYSLLATPSFLKCAISPQEHGFLHQWLWSGSLFDTLIL
jgi:hypothetical protein